MNLPAWLNQRTRRVWATLYLAVKKFWQIDGVQWAGAFAFNAFFSLFPLVVLFVTIASVFINGDRAGQEIIAYLERIVPINGEMQHYIFDTIAGVINARGQVGVIAFLLLVWVALQCFITLISATYRAWGIESLKWWRLPLKSLALLGITAVAVLIAMAAHALLGLAAGWLFPVNDFSSWVYDLGSLVASLLVLFLGLSLFYSLAPRRTMRFSQVWAAALFATVLLQAAESLFVIYLKNFATLNAIYGTFGGIMALLLWIYISGCIFIFGACMCAAQAEGR
jgi:YihY family inner membrane protein